MTKYKVDVLESFSVCHVLEVEANSEEQAREKALEEVEDFEYDVSDFEYSDSYVEIVEVKNED